MGVFLIVFLIVGGSLFLDRIWQTFGVIQKREEELLRARLALDIMGQTLREATEGEDGSFRIQKAGPREIIFFADVDGDSRIEKVSFYVGKRERREVVRSCQSFVKGGSCSVLFTDLPSFMKEALIRVKTKGDLGSSREYLQVFISGKKAGNLCVTGCLDCSREYERERIFDVSPFVSGNLLEVDLSATRYVDPICQDSFRAYAFASSVTLSYVTLEPTDTSLYQSITEPQDLFPIYNPNEERARLLVSSVVNQERVFYYLDAQGREIDNPQDYLQDIRAIKIVLKIKPETRRQGSEITLERVITLRNI